MSETGSVKTNNIPSDLLEGHKNQAKRIYIDAAHSGKAHLDAGARWQKWNTRLGVPATIASSISEAKEACGRPCPQA